MKYALCGILIGLTDSLIQNVKTRLSSIPKADYWLKDAQFTKTQENGINTVSFMFPFHKKAIRSNFVQKWIRFYWETQTIEDPETGEAYETRVRKYQVKDAIKILWSKCKSGSRIWVEMHDHDETVRRGCKIEDIIKK